MARSPCCDEKAVKKGPWTPEEDRKLKEYIEEHGLTSWRVLPTLAGLNRCGKSCRLRWTNYLRPDIKRGSFTDEEEATIIRYHSELGNKWSVIANHLPGRTDNEIKNHWNTNLRKKLLKNGIDPVTHQPRPDLALMATLPSLLGLPSSDTDVVLRNATQLARLQLLQSILNLLATNPTANPNPPGNMIPAPAMNVHVDPFELGLLDPSAHLHPSPDIGMSYSGSTSYAPAGNVDIAGPLVLAADVVDTSPGGGASSASDVCEYDAWGGLDQFLEGDHFYVDDGRFGYGNCF